MYLLDITLDFSLKQVIIVMGISFFMYILNQIITIQFSQEIKKYIKGLLYKQKDFRGFK